MPPKFLLPTTQGSIMKVTEEIVEFNADNVMNIGIDVASEKLDVYFELALKLNVRKICRDLIPNRTTAIEDALLRYQAIAKEQGYLNIRIVCEPTGPYSVNLLSVAKSLNCITAYVNPEAVYKSKIIETNESGKTDLIDAEIINSLAKRDKVLICRTYSADYQKLRILNSHYEDIENSYVIARNQVHNTLKLFFPDLSISKDTLYSNTGKTIQKIYGFNPWKITVKGFNHFHKTMRSKVKGVRNKTIQVVWDDAVATCRHNCNDVAGSLEERFTDHYEDVELFEKRKERVKKEMKEILSEIRLTDDQIPAARKNYVSEFHIARLLAETGPLSDFKTKKELLKYLGMNLRERQSGHYKGKTKMSKKGRSTARSLLSNIVLPLVKETALYGPAYHEKKKRTGKSGTLLMTNFMRVFLKSFFGLYKSTEEFNEIRMFMDEGAYNKLFKSKEKSDEESA